MKKEPLGLYLAKMILAVSSIIFFGSLIGGILWLSKNYPSKAVSQHMPSVPAPTKSISFVDEIKDWKTYQNKGYKFQIKVPPNWNVQSEPVLYYKTIINSGFPLGGSIRFTDYGNRRAMRITVSDKGNVDYDKSTYPKDIKFIETKPEKIVVGGAGGLSFFAEGTIYNYRVADCGDDNKMAGGSGLCYHSKIIKLKRGGLYYTLDADYMGADALKAIDNMIKTLEPMEYGSNAGIFAENGFVFNYPPYLGEYKKDQTKNTGILYYFENSPVDISVLFENKDFVSKRGTLYGGSILVEPKEVTDLDNYCAKNEKDLLFCKKISINSKMNGILEDKLGCNAGPTGGGIGCSYGRFFFTKTNDKDYPVFVLSMMLWQEDNSDPIYRQCDYDYTQDLDKTKKCFKENYEEYISRYENELELLDKMISGLKITRKGEISDWRTYKDDSFELRYPVNWKYANNSFFDSKYDYEDFEKPGLTLDLAPQTFGNEKESRIFKKENAYKDNTTSAYQKISVFFTNNGKQPVEVVCSFSDDLSVIDICNKIISMFKFRNESAKPVISSDVVSKIVSDISFVKEDVKTLTADLNNDGRIEVVAITSNYEKQEYKLYIFTVIDTKGNYKEVGEINLRTPMVINAIKDITGDNAKEIIAEVEVRGGTGGRIEYYLLSVDFKKSKISFIEAEDEKGKTIGVYNDAGGVSVGRCSYDGWVFGKDFNGDGKKEIGRLTAVSNIDNICAYYNSNESKDLCHICDLLVYRWEGDGFSYDKNLSSMDNSKIDPAELFGKSGCNSCEWVIK